MIILDTNILSELMRETPDPLVTTWISQQRVSELYLTTITVAEIQRGLAKLPKGKRRQRLELSFNEFVDEAFAGRILSFDLVAANVYGELFALREKAGYHAEAIDMMIAAIARTKNADIATRNTTDFQGCGIHLINPWASST